MTTQMDDLGADAHQYDALCPEQQHGAAAAHLSGDSSTQQQVMNAASPQVIISSFISSLSLSVPPHSLQAFLLVLFAIFSYCLHLLHFQKLKLTLSQQLQT